MFWTRAFEWLSIVCFHVALPEKRFFFQRRQSFLPSNCIVFPYSLINIWIFYVLTVFCTAAMSLSVLYNWMLQQGSTLRHPLSKFSAEAKIVHAIHFLSPYSRTFGFLDKEGYCGLILKYILNYYHFPLFIQCANSVE